MNLRNSTCSSLVLHLALGLLSFGGLSQAGAQELPYTKKETREATKQAAIESLQRNLTGVRQTAWKLIGPFDNPKAGGLDVIHPPEREINFDADYAGLEGERVRWRDGSKFSDGQIHDLNRFSRKDWVLGYLYRTIESDEDREVTLLVGSDDSVTIWLNGKKVHDYRGSRPTRLDSDSVPVKLREGTNHLLMKIGNYQGHYSFSYRLSPLSAALASQLDERLDEDFPTGESAFYRLETIAIPEHIRLEVGGMAFMPDGQLMICTRRGEIWSLNVENNEWRLFASGLHEPLGVYAMGAGDIVVAQRPELTRIRDLDGDGVADVFETMTDAFGVSGNYHEYHFGPVRDRAGNFYGTLNVAWEGKGTAPVPFRGTAYQLTPKGEFNIWAWGFRSPAGIELSPEGEMFVTDNQGDWWGTSPLLHVPRDSFHGHPASLKWKPDYSGPDDPHEIAPDTLLATRKLPAAWFVLDQLGRSPTEPIWDVNVGKFGPFAGQMFVGDQTRSMLIRVALEKVGGEYQGAMFPFRSGFASGILRLAFDAQGRLYAGQTDRGWGAIGGRPFAVQRVSWTGRMPMEIHTMRLTQTGFDLTFTQPVDRETASKAANYSLRHFHYEYHRKYGSPLLDERAVTPTRVEISKDGKTVSLILPEVLPRKVYELQIANLQAADGTPLLHSSAFYTLNRLRP